MINRPDPNMLKVDPGPDGIVIEFQGVITVWTPGEAKRLAKCLVECAREVEAMSATKQNGIVVR
jgi:hypothetical protein